MMTYVNDVIVANGSAVIKVDELKSSNSTLGKANLLENSIAFDKANVGNIIIHRAVNGEIRFGLYTKKKAADGSHFIKWTAAFNPKNVRSYARSFHKNDTEDKVTIDFGKKFNKNGEMNGKRVVVKLTYKDLPTRFRKWTEAYEYLVQEGETGADVAAAFVNEISNKYNKRARVFATADDTKLVLVAMPYTDDDDVDSLNWANKVRFSAHAWYTDPKATAFASKNKYFIVGASIEKEPGTTYDSSVKYVRDAESQAMGYNGVLNRGECTWPIIKPEMYTNLYAEYSGCTIMFENPYHTADDLVRKTKQSVQIFTKVNEGDAGSTGFQSTLLDALNSFDEEVFTWQKGVNPPSYAPEAQND